MKQSPKEELILAVKISIQQRNEKEPHDAISLLVLDPNEILKSELKMLHLLKLRCADTHIFDFSWHHLSYLTLIILPSISVL